MRAAWLALALAAAAPSSNAWCQDAAPGQREAGEALLQAGKIAYDAGDYPEALRQFEQAWARLGRPTIHYDIAQAAARAGDHRRALAAFREYLSALPNAPNRPEVERRIQAHERALTYAAPAQPAADLSPTAAASTQAEVTPSSDSSPPVHVADQGQSGELWWLWAGIGAAIVGTVVAALIVTSSDDPVQPPLRGDVGGTIQTLEVR